MSLRRVAGNPVPAVVRRDVDFWKRHGVRVREVLAELCEVPESRLDFRAPIDDAARFDLTLLPRSDTPEAMRLLMLEGVLKHFDLEIRRDANVENLIVVRGRDAVS